MNYTLRSCAITDNINTGPRRYHRARSFTPYSMTIAETSLQNTGFGSTMLLYYYCISGHCLSQYITTCYLVRFLRHSACIRRRENDRDFIRGTRKNTGLGPLTHLPVDAHRPVESCQHPCCACHYLRSCELRRRNVDNRQ